MKKVFIFLASLGLMYFTFNSINFSQLKPLLTIEFLINISLALIFIIFSYVISSIRWLILLKIIDKSLRPSEIFYIFYLTNTISTYIPGMLVGDYLRYKLLKNKIKTKDVHIPISYTVLTDRVLSLISLLINIYLFCLIFINNDGIIFKFTNYLLFGFIISIFTLIIIHKFRSVIITFLYKLEGFGGIRIYNFLQFINNNKLRIIFLIPFSMIANYAVLIAFYFITIAYELNLDFIASSISVQLAFFGTLIPLSPSGLGISEYIYSEMYSLITDSSDNIIYVYVAFRFVCLIVNMPSFFYIFKSQLLHKKQVNTY